MKHNLKCCCHVYQHVQTSGINTFLRTLIVLWILICYCVECTTLLLPLFFCFLALKCISNNSSWAFSDIVYMKTQYHSNISAQTEYKLLELCVTTPPPHLSQEIVRKGNRKRELHTKKTNFWRYTLDLTDLRVLKPIKACELYSNEL